MRRGVILIGALVGALAVVGAAVVFGVRLISGPSAASGPECTLPDPLSSRPLALDAVQLQHASTINAVGLARGIPEQGRVIALATAFTESGMRNLDHGDRDSLGLFQQRPSQGWGKPAQIMDPVYAAGAFYDALVKVSGWQDMAVTDAAQAVQYSAYPDAYAQWEEPARALALELGGTVEPTLSCRAGADPPSSAAPSRPPVPGATAADAGLAAVLAAAQAELGDIRVVSVAPGGRTATVSAALPTSDATSAARALAAWAVAHGTGFDVVTVRAMGRTWTDHRWSVDAGAPPADTRVTITVGS
jgi:hypothetical protein